MNAYASDAWNAIIREAAVSPLGITALALLVAGFVVLTLVKRSDKPAFRLAAILILLFFCGGLAMAAIYRVEPTVTVEPPGSPPGKAAEAAPPARPEPRQPPAASGAPDKGLASPAPDLRRKIERPALKPFTSPGIAPRSSARAPAPVECGIAWTDWADVRAPVPNPCPAGCTRGKILAQSFRAVGFPPRAQVRQQLQCLRG